VPAFLAFLAEDTKVGERTARQYVAHLQRFSAWLEQRYQAALLEATIRDLRQFKTELGTRQKPASVNAALAALRRFYGWAIDGDRVARNPAQHVTDVAAQPLAPKGFLDVERRRLVRQAEKDGPMVDAIVTLLLNTGLRVDELVTLTWQRVQVHPRSGWIDVVGKGDRHRRLPLNAEARKALEVIQPTPTDDVVGAIFRGKRGPFSTNGSLVANSSASSRVVNTAIDPSACGSAKVPIISSVPCAWNSAQRALCAVKCSGAFERTSGADW
jgi:site-specific recombinase XerC